MDVGGTKLLIGEMDGEGKLLRSKRYPSGYPDQAAATAGIVAALENYIGDVGFAGEPVALGLGIVGVVDSRHGIWVAMDHVRKQPVSLASKLACHSGLPVVIDNDVRCGTTAELLLGHGRETRNFVYMNVGTGIAASTVTDGRIIRGANCNAGEIGHMVVSPELGIRCVCGRIGCVEPIASGSGFTARIRAAHEAGVQTRISPVQPGRGADIIELFRLADEGDALARQLTDEAAEALARTVMNLVRVSDPDLFILGGGIVSDGWLLPKIMERLNKPTMRGVTRGVVLSRFDPELTGLIGAGAAAMSRYAERKDTCMPCHMDET